MLTRQLSSSKKCSPAQATAGLKIEEEITKRRKKKKQQSHSRSPLQDLNIFSRTNSSRSRTSTISISSSMSLEAPRGCLRFFLPNPSSASSSKTSLRRPKMINTPKSAPSPSRTSKPSSFSSSFASKGSKPPPKQKGKEKENLLTRPTSQKPKKNPPCPYQWQTGKKPSPRTASRPNPSPDLGLNAPINDSATSGSAEFGVNQKQLKQKEQQRVGRRVDDVAAGESSELFKLPDLNNTGNVFVENCTPVGKLACGSGLNCAIYDKPVGEDSNTSGTTSKTPPVQASVSPEIQCGSSILVLSATPACYGAGLVVSGVTDLRKCRPRGILAVGGVDSSGCGKANVSGDVDDNNNNPGASLIPLPAEASMRWALSPCDKYDEDQNGDSANGLCRKLVGSATLNIPSSPSSCHGVASDLCDNAHYDSTGNTNTTTSSKKTRITLVSPRRFPEINAVLGPVCDKVVGHSSSASPFATPSCKATISEEDRKYQCNIIGEKSSFSIDSSSSGNVIQTPQSDSSSDRHGRLSWLSADDHQTHKKHHFESELDSVVEVLRRASLSPRSHVSVWDPPGLSFQFTDLTSPFNSIDLNRLQKTLDDRASWISNSTLESASQSQMRISWREGLVSRIFEMDELDCCRCLSDEENDADGCSSARLESRLSYEYHVNLGNDPLSNKVLRSPEFLDQEPSILGKGTAKLSPQRTSLRAESICTDGGGLVASGDSDWTLCYKNQLFQV